MGSTYHTFGLSDIQVQRVLVCFLKEVFNGNLKLIDQTGWEEFEVLRVSATARQNWGLDLCMQMLYAANRKIKEQNSNHDGSLYSNDEAALQECGSGHSSSSGRWSSGSQKGRNYISTRTAPLLTSP